MKHAIWAFALIMVILGTGLFAETYTIDQCIQMARDTDPTLMQFRNSMKTAGTQVWWKAGQFLPNVSVSGNYRKVKRGPTSERVVDLGGGVIEVLPSQPEEEYSDYSAGYSISQYGFNVLGTAWDYLQSRAQKHGAEYSYGQTVSDLDFYVKTNYYLVLKSKNDLEVAQDAVGRSEELLKLFQEKYELGSASLSEVLKQKVQFGNDQLTLVRARNNYRIYRDQLALIVGINPNEDFDIADLELTTEEIGEIGDYISKVREYHPTLRSAEENVAASRHGVLSAWSDYLPTLDIGYSFNWSKNTFDDLKKFGPYDHTGSFYFGVSLSIFDRFQKHYSVSVAKANLNNARASEAYTRNEIIKDIRDAYLGIKLAEETLNVTGETERAASEDMELVQAKYNLGAAALWELLDAQVSLKTAQFDKVKAEFDYNLAFAKLKNAMGE